jgi:hypothetical protein
LAFNIKDSQVISFAPVSYNITMGVPTYSVLSGYKSTDLEAFERWIDKLLLLDRQKSNNSGQLSDSEPDEQINRIQEYRRWRRRLPDTVKKYAPYILGTQLSVQQLGLCD